MFTPADEHFMPPPDMDPALRAAIDLAIAGADADQPPELHFLHRRSDAASGYRPLPLSERRPQPGEDLIVGREILGTVVGVCAWWVNVPVGGRIVVVVFEVE